VAIRVAIRGNQWPSEAIDETHLLPLTRGACVTSSSRAASLPYARASTLLEPDEGGHQRSSAVIRGHQRSSEVISGNHTARCIASALWKLERLH